METNSTLLLSLYRAASEMSAAEFPNFAFELVKSALRYDSARLMTTKVIDKRMILQGAYVHKEPVDTALDWEEITRHDTVLRAAVEHRGKVINFNAPILYAAPEKGIIRNYAAQYEHQNGMAVVRFDALRDYWDGLSFYRAKADDQFAEPERQLMEALAPHLVEALKINEMLTLQAEQRPLDRATVAFAYPSGMLQHCGLGFMHLMRQEWPDWRSGHLPLAVMKELEQTQARRFTGKCIDIVFTWIGGLLLLRASPISALARLSPRELMVARSYATGQTHKQIARSLNLAPSTVRNFLQRIYLKLEINDKAELASLLAHEALN